MWRMLSVFSVLIVSLTCSVAAAHKPSEVLTQKVDAEFVATPLKHVAVYFGEVVGVRVELGRIADGDTLISFKAKEQPFGEVLPCTRCSTVLLKKLLAPHGLMFVVDAADTKFKIVPVPKPGKRIVRARG